MSCSRPPRLPGVVLAELDRVGLPWALEPGKKHWKLLVAGRLAVVLSRGSLAGETEFHRRQNLNAIRSIKRVVRTLGEARGL